MKRTWTPQDMELLRTLVGAATDNEIADSAWWIRECARHGIETTPGALRWSLDRATANTEYRQRAESAILTMRRHRNTKRHVEKKAKHNAEVATWSAPGVPSIIDGLVCVDSIPKGWMRFTDWNSQNNTRLTRQSSPGFVRWMFLSNKIPGRTRPVLILPVEDGLKWTQHRRQLSSKQQKLPIGKVETLPVAAPPVAAPVNGAPCARCKRLVLAQLLQAEIISVDQFATLA